MTNTPARTFTTPATASKRVDSPSLCVTDKNVLDGASSFAFATRIDSFDTRPTKRQCTNLVDVSKASPPHVVMDDFVLLPDIAVSCVQSGKSQQASKSKSSDTVYSYDEDDMDEVQESFSADWNVMTSPRRHALVRLAHRQHERPIRTRFGNCNENQVWDGLVSVLQRHYNLLSSGDIRVGNCQGDHHPALPDTEDGVSVKNTQEPTSSATQIHPSSMSTFDSNCYPDITLSCATTQQGRWMQSKDKAGDLGQHSVPNPLARLDEAAKQSMTTEVTSTTKSNKGHHIGPSKETAGVTATISVPACKMTLEASVDTKTATTTSSPKTITPGHSWASSSNGPVAAVKAGWMGEDSVLNTAGPQTFPNSMYKLDNEDMKNAAATLMGTPNPFRFDEDFCCDALLMFNGEAQGTA